MQPGNESLVLAANAAAHCPYCHAVVMFYSGTVEGACSHYVEAQVSQGQTFILFRADLESGSRAKRAYAARS
jgi:hypothetical protein